MTGSPASLHVALDDSELISYSSSDDELLVTVRAWDASHVRFRFSGPEAMVDRGAWELSYFQRSEEPTPFLEAALDNCYEAIPESHGLKAYEFFRDDNEPVLEVIARHVDLERIRREDLPPEDPDAREAWWRRLLPRTAGTSDEPGIPKCAVTVAFVGSLVHATPELRGVFQEHLDDFDGEILPHLFLSAVERWLERHAEKQPKVARRILDTLEAAFTDRNPEVNELIAVSFLEHLPRPGQPGSRLRKLVGRRMKAHLRVIG